MGEIRSFRDLIVWQRSIELAEAVYGLTRQFPREEIYGMTSQMRRASVSIASNIAEGQGRITTGEFRQFLGIARGSNFELQTQLVLSRKLGIGNGADIDHCEGLSAEVGKMLNSFVGSLGS